MRLITLLLLLFLTACDGSVSDSTQQVNEIYEQAKKSVLDITPDGQQISESAQEEIDKLFRIEYHTMKMDKHSSLESIQATLTKLGEDRWECFDTRTVEEELQILCHRRPRSYLRYLLKMF